MDCTALHDWHASNSGRMVDFAGWEMPIWYESIISEHHAVRQKSGLFDIGHMGRLWFTGPDACSLLDRVVTNNVPIIKDGQIRYALVCNEDGGILDDVLVYRFGDDYMLVVNASNREKIVDWITPHLEGVDCEMRDRTHDWFMLALQGPEAINILPALTDDSIRDLKYYTGAIVSADDAQNPTIVTRTGYTGEDGFEVIINASQAVDLWERIVSAGADAGLKPCGLGCRDTLRLEAAMPLYGHEMDETVDPFTAGLSFGVKLNAGDFIGKSALTTIRERDDLPVRVGLELDGKRAAREGAKILAEERIIGTVTSGTFSPTLEKSLAMGMVPAEFAIAGTQVVIDIRGKQHPASVTALPFYKRG